MVYEDSSDQSSDDESQDDDFDILVLDSIFPPKTDTKIPRLNLEDVSEERCERMFRYYFPMEFVLEKKKSWIRVYLPF
jgi:hypothetical protein